MNSTATQLVPSTPRPTLPSLRLLTFERAMAVAARPAFVKPAWWNETPNGRYRERYRTVVKTFLEGRLKKMAVIGNGRHIFTSRKKGEELWLFKDNDAVKVSVCIAKKVNGRFVGNSSSLMAMRTPKGKLGWAGSQMVIQEFLRDTMPMVPFRTFEEAGLNMASIHIVDQGPDEQLMIENWRSKKREPRHFTGAMVFSLGGKRAGERSYYLFDVDRNDAAMGVFNPFLSRLARPVKMVAEAYASLKPKEVADAEAAGMSVLRQGEWFFIPVSGEFKKVRTGGGSWNVGSIRCYAQLQSKGNRPHYVSERCEEGYVWGTVLHGGWEHKPVKLPGWCKPVPNTAVESFQISGAVD